MMLWTLFLEIRKRPESFEYHSRFSIMQPQIFHGRNNNTWTQLMSFDRFIY